MLCSVHGQREICSPLLILTCRIPCQCCDCSCLCLTTSVPRLLLFQFSLDVSAATVPVSASQPLSLVFYSFSSHWMSVLRLFLSLPHNLCPSSSTLSVLTGCQCCDCSCLCLTTSVPRLLLFQFSLDVSAATVPVSASQPLSLVFYSFSSHWMSVLRLFLSLPHNLCPSSSTLSVLTGCQCCDCSCLCLTTSVPRLLLFQFSLDVSAATVPVSASQPLSLVFYSFSSHWMSVLRLFLSLPHNLCPSSSPLSVLTESLRFQHLFITCGQGRITKQSYHNNIIDLRAFSTAIKKTKPEAVKLMLSSKEYQTHRAQRTHSLKIKLLFGVRFLYTHHHQ